MIRPLNVLFLLADASHGRMVSLSRQTGDYVTLAEHRNGKPPRKGEPTVVFQSFGEGRHTSEQGSGATTRAETDFIRRLAEEATGLCKQGGFSGIALVALPRTIALLKRHLPPTAPIVGQLAKDLTKVRDHDLAAWLRSVRPLTES